MVHCSCFEHSPRKCFLAVRRVYLLSRLTVHSIRTNIPCSTSARYLNTKGFDIRPVFKTFESNPVHLLWSFVIQIIFVLPTSTSSHVTKRSRSNASSRTGTESLRFLIDQILARHRVKKRSFSSCSKVAAFPPSPNRTATDSLPAFKNAKKPSPNPAS